MVIEFARNVLGLNDATSSEFDTDKHSKNHVIMFMPEIDDKVGGVSSVKRSISNEFYLILNGNRRSHCVGNGGQYETWCTTHYSVKVATIWSC